VSATSLNFMSEDCNQLRQREPNERTPTPRSAPWNPTPTASPTCLPNSACPARQAAIDSIHRGTHAPLAHELKLADAPFWTAAQAGFLKSELDEDADWSAVIDTLDARLRHGI
jgi:hypothetical protein